MMVIEKIKELEMSNPDMTCSPSLPVLQRWYYDITTGKCTSFEYSGIGGNANRFLTEDECKKRTSGLYQFLTQFVLFIYISWF